MVLYCIVLYHIILYCIILYYIVLYCMVWYGIVLYCIVLYYIVTLALTVQSVNQYVFSFVEASYSIRLILCTLSRLLVY